jgi:YggT family protein
LRLIFDIVDVIGSVIWWISLGVAGLLVLRVIIAWATSNPFLWLPYQLRRVTEPMVRPFRQPFSGYYMRFDMLPLVAAVMVLLAGWFVASIIMRLGDVSEDIYSRSAYGVLTTGFLISRIILLAGTLYEAAIFLRFVLPWVGVGYANAFMRFLFKITEPLLRPLRRLLGNLVPISMFDVTPLLAIMVVWLVTMILANLAA